MNYIFQSARLGFRKWVNDDIIPFSEMNKDDEVMEFFPSTLSEEESTALVDKINEMFNQFGYGLYVVDKLETKEFIGFVGFWHPPFESDFTPCVEIGWRINKENWNNGYATEGAKECLRYGFNQLRFKEVYSFTSKVNTKSEKVMQKIGMYKVKEFEHPKIKEGNELRSHILYKIENPIIKSIDDVNKSDPYS